MLAATSLSGWVPSPVSQPSTDWSTGPRLASLGSASWHHWCPRLLLQLCDLPLPQALGASSPAGGKSAKSTYWSARILSTSFVGKARRPGPEVTTVATLPLALSPAFATWLRRAEMLSCPAVALPNSWTPLISFGSGTPPSCTSRWDHVPQCKWSYNSAVSLYAIPDDPVPSHLLHRPRAALCKYRILSSLHSGTCSWPVSILQEFMLCPSGRRFGLSVAPCFGALYVLFLAAPRFGALLMTSNSWASLLPHVSGLCWAS